MKEQNKPETVIQDGTVGRAAEDMWQRGSYRNDERAQTIYILGAEFGSKWQSKQLYTAEDCAKMLEMLRQRCAEEANKRQSILGIDVHQFIPPLTKQ